MVDAWLVVIVVILTLAIIAGNIYILVYFSHPEDKNVAWFPKVVVVLGLTLAGFSILMLPLDVANGAQQAGGFPMDVLWLAIYIIIAGMVVIVIPFAIFYYEAEEADDSDEAPSQIGGAIKGTLITFFVFAALTVILWFTIGIAEIPVVKFNATLETLNPPTQAEYLPGTNGTDLYTNLTELAELVQGNCTNHTIYNYINNTNTNSTGNITTPEILTTIDIYPTGDNITVLYVNYTEDCVYPYFVYPTGASQWHRENNQFLKFRVSFLLYIISMVVFFGWILFIVFGGIGLIALPFDCINDFNKRPIRISHDVYAKGKKEIGERATKLIEIGAALREKQKHGGGSSRRARRRARTNYNKFRQAVFFLEEDYEHLQVCFKRQGGKVLLYYAMLLFGIVGACLTVLWVLQIFLYLFTQPNPFNPFLNTMLTAMDGVFPFFGTVFYGLFAFYLLLCVIKGNFKFGMRVFILFPIHPMRVGATLMNAFLFNTLLILICAVSITQFTTQAFGGYAKFTQINQLFGLAVRNLEGIRYVFLAYIYVLFAVIFLAGIYFAVKPKDKPATDSIILT